MLVELGFHKSAALPTREAVFAMDDALRVKHLQNAERAVLKNNLYDTSTKGKLQRIRQDGMTAGASLHNRSIDAMKAYNLRSYGGRRTTGRKMEPGESFGRRYLDNATNEQKQDILHNNIKDFLATQGL